MRPGFIPSWVTHKTLKLLGLPQLLGEAVKEEALALWAGQHVDADHIKDDFLGGKGRLHSVPGGLSLMRSPRQVLVNSGEHLVGALDPESALMSWGLWGHY